MRPISTLHVESRDGNWTARFDYDFDGPMEDEPQFFFKGEPFPYDVPRQIVRELTDKAWTEFHGRDLPDEDYEGDQQ